ncbi:MAG: thiamine phosphate synthase [Planctomycetia bacterium]
MSAPGQRAALRLVYVVGAAAAARPAHVEAVLQGGATALWLRAPEASGAELFRMAQDLLARCRRHGAALLVGDRADVALACGADGVQLGHRAPPPAQVRPWYRGWLGVSCHDAQQLAAARAAGADHAVLSPVFGVPEKGAPLGPAALAQLVAGAGLPVVALGGIEPGNVAEVAASGAVGVAVVRALRDAPQPGVVARGLLAAMTRA